MSISRGIRFINLLPITNDIHTCCRAFGNVIDTTYFIDLGWLRPRFEQYVLSAGTTAAADTVRFTCTTEQLTSAVHIVFKSTICCSFN